MTKVLSSALHWYDRFMLRRPMFGSALTLGLIGSSGDALSQLVIEKKGRNFDATRTLRFLIYGTAIGGPISRSWYSLLDKRIVASKLKPLKMVLLDQTLAAPVFVTLFLVGMGIMRGDNVQRIKEQYQSNFLVIYLNSLKVWPAAQLVNFTLIPLQHRVPFVSVIALFWNTYLAWKVESAGNKKQVA